MLTQGSFEGFDVLNVGPLPSQPTNADLGAWFAVGGALVSLSSNVEPLQDGLTGYVLNTGTQLQAMMRTSVGQKYTFELEMARLTSSVGRVVVEVSVLCQSTKTDANAVTALHIFESPDDHSTMESGVWTVRSVLQASCPNHESRRFLVSLRPTVT